MNLVLSSESIGSDRNLLYNGKTWTWVSSYPKESFLWGFDDYRDIREAMSCIGIEIPNFLSTPHTKAFKYLGANIEKIPWSMCMKKSKYKEIIKNIVDQLWMNINDESNSYYITTHRRNRKLIQGLVSPYIDMHEVKRISLENINENSNLNSNLQIKKFISNGTNVANKSTYSLSSSVTGRMTISSGPNILTLKKENRSIIKSRYNDGSILEIDIKSAEPRVALSLIGKSVSGDIYSEIMNSIGVKISREAAKIATLSAIYGASHHSLKSRLPDSANSRHVLDSVKNYFRVSDLEKVIHEQKKDFGYISNTHGRKIFSSEPSVNHLIQSSTVDVSFDIFENLFAYLDSQEIDYKPLYFIHDAVIIDVRGSDKMRAIKACSDGFISKKVGTLFPVSVEEIK